MVNKRTNEEITSPNSKGKNLLGNRAWALFVFLICPISSFTLAGTPIPRQGDSCPTGTYKSGSYCKPFKSAEGDVIIPKSGKDCPTGFYASSGYCKRIKSSDREAITREKGAKCPTGWRKSGQYCVEI